MRSAISLGTPLLLMASACPALAEELSPQEIFRRVAPSVVVIDAMTRPKNGPSKLITSGSGVVIPGGNKYGNRVVTNCHVVDSDPDGELRISQGSKSGFGVLAGRDDARDICIIAALVFEKGNSGLNKGIELPQSQISSSSTLEVGDSVYAVGAPQGLELSLSNGLVSGFREYKGSEYIQTTAPISKGSSGGGLFDAQGRLVGITTMYFKDGQSLNFAVPAELIAAVQDVGNGRPGQPSGATPTEAQAAADAAAAAGASAADAAQTSADAAAQAADAAAAKMEEENRHTPKERWWTFYDDSEQAIAFDTKTVSKDGRDVTVWERTRFAKPQRWDSSKTYVEHMTRATYYCGSRQRSYDQVTYRDANGLVVVSHQLKSYQVERQDIMPETRGEAMYEAACES